MGLKHLDLTGKHILIAEDDNDLRASIKSILALRGASVTDCENGELARIQLERATPFDLLLTDIRMPKLDGIQLLKISKNSRPELKVIVFTGFSEYLETHTAAELGADGFLSKPFKLTELLELIKSLLDDAPLVASLEQTFCKVHVDEFFSTTKLVSDIFIQLNAQKFVRLAKEGAEIDLSRLQHIKDHNVTHLFVRTEDFHKYTGFNLRLIRALKDSERVSEQTKLRLFKHTGEMLLQHAFVANIEKQNLEDTEAMVTNTIKSISENDDLFDVLLSIQNRKDDLYGHSLNVSVQASLIAKELGWTSLANQHKIVLTALFHDVGFKEIPGDLWMKPRFKMSPEDVKQYESHAARGRDILNSIESFPKELAGIVVQHHENGAATGYPAGLTNSKTHPFARLIYLADEFVDRMAQEAALTAETPRKILMDFFENRREDMDLEMLAAIFDLYKITRPLGLKNKAA